MTSETDTLPTGGTESAQTSKADNSAPEWDYYDPDEDQDTGTPQPEPEIESAEETVETDDPEDAGQPEDDSDEATAEPADESDEPAPKVTDDVKVTLPDGTELPLSEIKNGYLRQSDYTRKTTELATERKTVEAHAERITRTVGAFAEYLASRIPPAPDYNLSVTDPGRFVREKAAHEAAVAQVSQILEMGSEAKSVAGDMDAGKQRETLARENEALIRAFPETAKPEGRKAFFGSAIEAAKSLGYADDEIKGASDHRLYGLAYWASKGMAAEKAKVQAKTKVQDVPPVANPKRPASTAKAQKGRDAMRRLSQTGSIHDAMKVDWD